MTEQFGSTQIKELHFDKREIERIVLDNIIERAGTPYDFDYERPYILYDKNGGLIIRFVQTKVTLESSPRDFYLKEFNKSNQ